MYLEDLVFALGFAIVGLVALLFYIIVEVHSLRTVVDDYIWYTWGGGANADTTVADD